MPLSHEHAHAPDLRIRPPLDLTPARSATPPPPRGYHHTLHLTNAYESLGVAPELTNKTPDFEGVIDYIFTSSLLTPKGVLPTPTAVEAAREGGGLPSSMVPSDHVPIGASFDFATAA